MSAVEAKSRDLEKVVEDMTQEFVGFSDALVAGGNVDESVIGPLLRGTLERFLELGKKAAREPGESGQESDGEDDASTIKGAENEMEKAGMSENLVGEWEFSTGVLAEGDLPFLTPEFLSPLSLPEQEFHNLVTTASNLTTFDPYLNNVWQSGLAPSFCPSILPHILAGRDSFASRLYFETVSLAVRSLSGDAPYHFVQAMFRFKLRYASRTQLSSLLSGVLNTLLQGTSSFEGEVYDRKDVKAAIVSEVERGGAREEEFLNTWEVERYLRTRWRLGLDSQAVRVQPASEYASDGSIPASVLSLFAPTVVPGFVGEGTGHFKCGAAC